MPAVRRGLRTGGGDRLAGLAGCNDDPGHRHAVSDREVDTSEACAARIKADLGEGHPPQAFQRLADETRA